MLIQALPGTKTLKQVGENEYEGELQIRIGPIAGSFGGKLTVSNERPLESVTLSVEGAGKIGFVKGSGDVTFIEQGEAKTLIRYSGEIQIGGRVASVGQRLFDTVSKSMIEQGLNKLNGILKEGVAARKSG
jgi:carbon monoxide dehydrogenase subunit G